MTEGDFAINGGFPGARVTPSSVTGRFAAVCSKVQNSRIDHELPLPSVLKNPFIIVDGPQSSAAGNPEEITKLFPKLFGQPSAALVPSDSHAPHANRKLKIGVVLSGGQAPGGHNVISGIFDYLQDLAEGSTLYGFRGGPAGIMKCKYVELTSDYIYPYRNQGPMPRSRTKQSKDTLQQMVPAILNKAQVKNDEGLEALPIILIVAKGPN